MLLTMIWTVTASWAAKKPYGKVAAKGSARTEAASQKTVLARVPIDPSVELVRLHNEWGPLRFAETSRKATDRWLSAMFQGALPSERTLSRSLEIDNLILREKIVNLEREKSILDQQEKQMAERLRKMEADYEDLKINSATYLQVKEDQELTKSALALANENVRSLAQENEGLKMSRRIKWIIIGALVLFSGWITGIIMGSRRKKRRPTYHV